MTKCKKCNVNIETSVKRCPLCKNEVEEDESFGEFNNNVYPFIEFKKPNTLWQKILGLIFLLGVIITMLIDFTLNNRLTWSIVIALAIASVGTSIVIGVEKKKSLANIILYEYLFICIILYFWSRLEGFEVEYLNYVLPFFSSFIAVTNLVLRFVFNKRFFRYYRNVLISSLVCIFCWFLFYKGIITFLISSMVAGILGSTLIVFEIIFDGKRALNNLKRGFHI